MVFYGLWERNDNGFKEVSVEFLYFHVHENITF